MLKANLILSDHYLGADLDKLNRAVSVLEQTINGDKFRDAILNFKSFQFVKYKCLGIIKVKRIQLETYSNADLYDFLMKGHRQAGADSFMDLKLRLSEKDGGSAVGETDNNNVTTTYRPKFDSMNEGQLAAHYTHEWTHTMGFQHSFSNSCDSTRDCLSVPYAIGNMIEIITTGKCWYGCKYESLK